jgi:hypothetical protein
MADSLLLRTAKACYRADEAPKTGDWSSLPKVEQRRYEKIAAAALAVAFREPITADELADEAAALAESQTK